MQLSLLKIETQLYTDKIYLYNKNQTMDIALQIILSVAPAVVVFFTTALFLRNQGEKEMKTAHMGMKKERQKHFLPERTDAYQRAVLLLERIHPNSLIMRVHNPGLPAKAFQSDLLSAVREEYDHNVAQQLFVSNEAWGLLKKAKDETVKIINIAGEKMSATSMSTDLAQKIFEMVGEIGELPTEIALDYVKKEFQELL